MDQDLETGQEDHVQRGAKTHAEMLDRAVEVLSDRKDLLPPRKRAHCGAWPVGREVDRRHEVGELGHPVVFGRLPSKRGFGARLRAHVIHVGGHRRQRGRQTLRVGRVESGEVAQHDARRPSVAGDVVGGEDEDVGLVVLANQPGAYQRSTGEVERLPALAFHDALELVRGLGACPRRQVHEGQLDGEDLVDTLFALGVERGAQRGVAVHHSSQGSAECFHVEPARQAQREALVVGARRFAPHLHGGPHLALGLGHGQHRDGRPRERVVVDGD